MKNLLKQLVPPIVHTLRWYRPEYGWKGDFAQFSDAAAQAAGYDAQAILQRVRHTSKRVVNGEIAYERDGIEYDEPDTNINLMAALLYVASQYKNRLSVLDFGGSLGTTYYQLKPWLSGLSGLQWNIVEQGHYVELGQSEFSTPALQFYPTIEECVAEKQPQVIVFCGVIQYIEDYLQLLERVYDSGIPYLVLDYVGYNDGPAHRITIQHVPPEFYGVPASYPCRFFSKELLDAWLAERYELQFEFLSSTDTYYLELIPFQYKGQFWKRKNAHSPS